MQQNRKKLGLYLLLEKNRAITCYTKALEFRNCKSFRKVTEQGYSSPKSFVKKQSTFVNPSFPFPVPRLDFSPHLDLPALVQRGRGERTCTKTLPCSLALLHLIKLVTNAGQWALKAVTPISHSLELFKRAIQLKSSAKSS